VSQNNTLAPTPTPAEMLTNLQRWTKRATKGDQTARQQLRQLVDRPDCFLLFRDLASRVRDALIRKFAGDDCFVKALHERDANRVRAELLGPTPTAIERLLAERVNFGDRQVNVSGRRRGVRQNSFCAAWRVKV
jgi:hypothetical protein